MILQQGGRVVILIKRSMGQAGDRNHGVGKADIDFFA
jgi:hypothetical protein